MIIKGRSRGGSVQLADYLLSRKNERAVVLEVSGTTHETLRGSLREMEAVGLNATSSDKVLYHAQIAPAHADRLTEQQYIAAADRLEAALGFTGQPRAVVLHHYQGHAHAHVVWSRADVVQGKVISDSWDRRQHHRVCRDLEQEWNLVPVQSAYLSKTATLSPRQRDTEHRQNSRLRDSAREQGQTFREKDIAKKEIAWCWENSSNGKQTRNQLQQMGYTLAQGRAGPVVIDEQTGACYSLARASGVTRKRAEARCGDVIFELPTREELEKERAEKKASTPIRRRMASLKPDDLQNAESLIQRFADDPKHTDPGAVSHDMEKD